jgi:small subunit ribosomal protein S17
MAEETKVAGAGTGAATRERGHRKVIEGIVRSNKMQKTITVETEYLQKHPKYGKYVKKFTRYYAHDEKNEAKPGDLVEIIETRPLSKLKRFRLLRVVRQAEQI